MPDHTDNSPPPAPPAAETPPILSAGSTPTTPRNPLEILALARFPDLNQTERGLVIAAPAGEIAVAAGTQLDPLLPDNDPAKGAEWGPQRYVRPDLIRWLCSHPQAQKLVDPQGIRLFAAKISGPLNLSHVTVPFPVRLQECFLADNLVARDATLETLDLCGSFLAGYLLGAGLKVKHDLSLSRLQSRPAPQSQARALPPPFRSEKGIDLGNAAMGGDVNLSGASINGSEGSEGTALHMDGASIYGSVFLDKKLTAKGQVRLNDANIDGILFCGAGRFENPSGSALSAARVSVKRDVFLNQKFTAKGEVRLLGATIGGNLICAGGTFENPGGDALFAHGVSVRGGVYLSENFSATGAVRLDSAKIDGNLECGAGTFENPFGNGLVLARANVQGSINLREMKLDSGTSLDLLDCSAGQLMDDAGHWPQPGKLRLSGFKYGSITVSVMQARARLDWLRRQYPLREDLQFSLQPYRHLAGVLDAHGLDADARTIRIAMEDDRRKYAGLSRWEKSLSRMLQVTVGYGYKPFLAVIWLLAFWLVGWFVFAGLYQSGRLVPAQKDAFDVFRILHAPPTYYESFCAPVYSADAVLPFVNLGQRDAWRPLSPSEASPGSPSQGAGISSILCSGRLLSDLPHTVTNLFARLARPFHWLLILMGWFFATMFALGVSGLVRRD
jgi:hypothetical protein